MSDLFYLQDSRNNVGSRAMFWKDGGGYTSNLGEAEQFTRAEAFKQYECRETDLPWPVDYVRALAEVGVDHQFLSRSDADTHPNEDGRLHAAYPRDWDGNDLIWKGSGRPTSNLDYAIHPGAAEAAEYRVQGFELWPCGYIDERSRPVVQACKLDHKKALRAAGLKLPKVQRQKARRETYRCGAGYGGCGRFLRPADYYTSCPHCGTGNAP